MSAVHLVAFGNLPKYLPVLRRIKGEAEATGYFASIKLYIPEMLERLKPHQEFVDANPRGYGYWIWKPLMILARMAEVPEDDIVMMVDAGCSLYANPVARQRFAEWVAAVQAHPTGRLACQTTHPEAMWCKGDVFERFGVRPEGGQVMAGLTMWKNTAANRAFLEEWFSIMVEDNYHYVNDTPSRTPNTSLFREHRHDMAIFSLLIKRDGAALIEHPGCDGDDQPVKITRRRPR